MIKLSQKNWHNFVEKHLRGHIPYGSDITHDGSSYLDLLEQQYAISSVQIEIHPDCTCNLPERIHPLFTIWICSHTPSFVLSFNPLYHEDLFRLKYADYIV